MSVKIRLSRAGARHRPFYRIVVTDSRMPRDGRIIQAVGTYDPLAKSENVTVDGELVKDWMRKGARPSVSVKHLLKRAGVVVETPAVEKKIPKAVPLEELRQPRVKAEGEEPEEAEKPEKAQKAEKPEKPERRPSAKAAPKKKAPSKSAKPKAAKPARKGTSVKKKAE
ncbi:MAG: 30S ribosomal protein S16 [Candidatus Eiseniibacteriota bacterium]|nr:MAG: 30S ribosomal protein S16 [Candidatus Eisenbacteria bacterium]